MLFGRSLRFSIALLLCFSLIPQLGFAQKKLPAHVVCWALISALAEYGRANQPFDPRQADPFTKEALNGLNDFRAAFLRGRELPKESKKTLARINEIIKQSEADPKTDQEKWLLRADEKSVPLFFGKWFESEDALKTFIDDVKRGLALPASENARMNVTFRGVVATSALMLTLPALGALAHAVPEAQKVQKNILSTIFSPTILVTMEWGIEMLYRVITSQRISEQAVTGLSSSTSPWSYRHFSLDMSRDYQTGAWYAKGIRAAYAPLVMRYMITEKATQWLPRWLTIPFCRRDPLQVDILTYADPQTQQRKYGFFIRGRVHNLQEYPSNGRQIRIRDFWQRWATQVPAEETANAPE